MNKKQKGTPMTGMEVKKWRESIGLSRMGLAKKTGISYFTIVKWELGKTNPSPMAQEKIDKLLEEK
jgi:DNA-binding transcriptional regulator YiaG